MTLHNFNSRLVEAGNRIEQLKICNTDLDRKLAEKEEILKLLKDEKLESEIHYNILKQKYTQVQKDYNDLLNTSLQIKQEQIEKINKMNDLENELVSNRNF